MAVSLQMVVVPDNATAKELPSVEGMMVYQKDSKKVYVLEDKKLSALAKENEVGYKHDLAFSYLFLLTGVGGVTLGLLTLFCAFAYCNGCCLASNYVRRHWLFFFTLGHDLAKSKLNYLSLFCKYYCLLQITHQ